MVERVLADLGPYIGSLWLAAHRELKTNRRIRTVFDFLISELSPEDEGTPCRSLRSPRPLVVLLTIFNLHGFSALRSSIVIQSIKTLTRVDISLA